MYHFNVFGCKIGKTALEKRRKIQCIQYEKALVARKKEEAAYLEKKRKYDAVMNLQITNDTKLTEVQLRLLLSMKRRKTDKPISTMKKVDMLALWKEWKTRSVEAPQYDHNLVESAQEVSNDGNDTTTHEITHSKDGEENGVVSI